MGVYIILFIMILSVGLRAGRYIYLAYDFIAGVIKGARPTRPDVDSYSMYRKDLYDTKESGDEFYNRFD